MPVWAAITVPLIAFVWVAWLIVNWLDDLRWRHQASRSFQEWMNQERSRDA